MQTNPAPRFSAFYSIQGSSAEQAKELKQKLEKQAKSSIGVFINEEFHWLAVCTENDYTAGMKYFERLEKAREYSEKIKEHHKKWEEKEDEFIKKGDKWWESDEYKKQETLYKATMPPLPKSDPDFSEEQLSKRFGDGDNYLAKTLQKALDKGSFDVDKGKIMISKSPVLWLKDKATKAWGYTYAWVGVMMYGVH